MSPARWLAIFIATGIGLHNFSEGLAIGQSAASDQVSLAIVLIIGFGLHNATEGLGICAPLAGDKERPSWAFLGLLGLIGGGPTFSARSSARLGQRERDRSCSSRSRPARSSTS
jgi:ZIP family zinc transporter